MKKITIAIILVIGLALGGCSGMSDTEQRTLSGAAIGTGAGAAVGAVAGNTAVGAIVGAAAGTAGGYLFERHQKSEEKASPKDNKEGKKE
jgi:osmotically inducible lipoprotein OsmB